MSYQRSPVAPESSRSEANEEPSSEAKKDNDEDGTHLWKDIQVQTGFDSYKDYVAAYMAREDRSDLELLWRSMPNLDTPSANNICSIVDVLAPEDSPPTLSMRCVSRSGFELLTALRQPSKHVHVRVVFWQMWHYTPKQLMDILGLGLRIDPQVFLALMGTLKGLEQLSGFDEAVETRPFRPSHVLIDRAVATFVRHCPFNKPAAPPIVLIVGEIYDEFMEPGNLGHFTCVTDQRINRSPPFVNPSQGIELPPAIKNLKRSQQRWLQRYEVIFKALAVDSPGITSCTAAIIASVLMPLLQRNCIKTRTRFLRLRQIFLAHEAATNTNNTRNQSVNHTSSTLHQERFRLRRSLEDSDDCMNHFERYISAEDAEYLPKSSAYLQIKQERDQIHDEARRLDTEVRDYLQLVVGNLSLEESRKSIELSNQQILEGKRVKIFTILAFVYVPLNLATSIFGMNLQQLNKSGQNLWVFVLTGVVALLVTGMAWLCVEVITNYKGLPGERSTEDSRRNSRFVFRLALLVWLVKNGYTTWMWRSGAWLCILSNDKLGKFRGHDPQTDKSEETCDYVYRSIQSEELWRNFDLDTVW